MKRKDEALENISVYGCGMLSIPAAAANMPQEQWLSQRIREYERVAYKALKQKKEDDE